MYYIVIYTHVCGGIVLSHTYVYIHVYTRIRIYVYLAEWSVVRDIGEAKLHPLFFPSDSRDGPRIPLFE